MSENTEENDELAAKVEKVGTPARLTPAAALKSIAAGQPAHSRSGSKPKRLSKGQRKHLRRQKQAGEAKIIDRRQ